MTDCQTSTAFACSPASKRASPASSSLRAVRSSTMEPGTAALSSFLPLSLSCDQESDSGINARAVAPTAIRTMAAYFMDDDPCGRMRLEGGRQTAGAVWGPKGGEKKRVVGGGGGVH